MPCFSCPARLACDVLSLSRTYAILYNCDHRGGTRSRGMYLSTRMNNEHGQSVLDADGAGGKNGLMRTIHTTCARTIQAREGTPDACGTTGTLTIQVYLVLPLFQLPNKSAYKHDARGTLLVKGTSTYCRPQQSMRPYSVALCRQHSGVVSPLALLVLPLLYIQVQ